MNPPALDPQGSFAQPLSDLSWVLIASMTVVFVLVVTVTLVAISGRGSLRQAIGRPASVVLGGLVLPAAVLTGLLVWSLDITSHVSKSAQPGDLRIRVTGEMWWWRIHYLDGERILFETANEIHVPAGRTVAFELRSNDVIHSFWVPQLGGKMDMVPGRTNVLRLQAARPGVYRGQCSEYCGAAHALMAMHVIATPQAEFDAWAVTQASEARSADAAWELFADSGCPACHTVRGTSADGQIGPDLTHVGSRMTIGAGILSNDSATLRRFIHHAGVLKPGLRMPDYDRLPARDIDAIATWLEGLK